MGRTKRGKLLIPSLIAVASAVACGGASIGDGGDGIGDPGSAGASYGISGGSTISSGGANSIPPAGTSYAGGPATGGAAGVFYGCPPSVPPDGSRCAMPPNNVDACEYSDSCGQRVFAICHQGANWELFATGMECDANAGAPNYPSLSCPPTRPPTGSQCAIPADLVSYQCMYPNGCGQRIETCDQRHVWFAADTFGDCAGAGGAG